MNKELIKKKVNDYIKTLTSDLEFDEYDSTDKITFISDLMYKMNRVVKKYQQEFLESHVTNGVEVLESLSDESIDILTNTFNIKHITIENLYYFIMLISDARIPNANYIWNYGFLLGYNINETILKAKDVTTNLHKHNYTQDDIKSFFGNLLNSDKNEEDMLYYIGYHYVKYEDFYKHFWYVVDEKTTRCFADGVYNYHLLLDSLNEEIGLYTLFTLEMYDYYITTSGFGQKEVRQTIIYEYKIKISKDNRIFDVEIYRK